jgi:hypothetical protein
LAHHQTDHAIQKSSGLQFRDQQIALSLKSDLLNGGATVGTMAPSSLKGGKVMVTEHAAQREIHGLLI